MAGSNEAVKGGGWRTTRLFLPNDVIIALQGAGAPTDGTTGAGVAGPGSLYVDTANGAIYSNTNTKASPTWSVLPAPGAGSVTSSALASNTIQYVRVVISNAAVKTLHSVPVNIIPAP